MGKWKYQPGRGRRKRYKFGVTFIWHFYNSPFCRIICGDKGQTLKQYISTMGAAVAALLIHDKEDSRSAGSIIFDSKQSP